jgi:hypothetical protein
LLDRAVVPVAEEPPDPVPAEVVLPAVSAALDRPPPLEIDPVAELPVVVPVVFAVAGLVCVALVVVVAVVVGKVTAPYGLARLVPVTPRVVVVAVVCAEAGGISGRKRGNTKIKDLKMRLTIPPSVSYQCCGAEQRSTAPAFETA